MYKEDNNFKSSEAQIDLLLHVKQIGQQGLIFKTQASLTGVIEKKVCHSLQPAYTGQAYLLINYPFNTEQNDGKSKQFEVCKLLF